MKKYLTEHNKKKIVKSCRIYSSIVEDIKIVVGCTLVIRLRSYK